jgi:hypothetical protein
MKARETATTRRARPRSRQWIYAAVPLVVALSALTACEDDPVEPEEPEIGTVRLTLGSQTLNLEGGATVSATISGASTAVSATFLADDGSALALDEDEFEIRLLPQTSGVVTFSRSGAFSGALSRVAAGSVVVDVEVFHKIEGHEDFSARLSLTVQ